MRLALRATSRYSATSRIATRPHSEDRVRRRTGKACVQCQTHCPSRHRPAEVNKVKRVQWSYVGLLTEALQVLSSYGRRKNFQPNYTEWHTELAELKRSTR